MLAVKNGFKCTLRSPGKTALFLVILTVISALLTLSFGVFAAVRGYIADCDQYYHTIAELEYVGRDYPDPFVYDEAVSAAIDENRGLLEGVLTHDAVLSFEPAKAYIAVSDPIRRRDGNVYDPEAAVLDVRIMSCDKPQASYTAVVDRTLYSRKDYTGKLVMLRAASAEGGLEGIGIGKNYIVAGRFYKDAILVPCFMPTALSFVEDGETVTVSEPVLSGDSTADDVYHRLARDLHFKNDSVRVTYTSAIEDLFPFHQQVLKLSSGRFFTEEEYETKARVCIVSERIAGMMELSVGDRISFDVYGSSGDIYSYSALEKADEGEYEIVGIQTESDSFPYRVFMPDKDAVHRGLGNVNGYNLGQFRLKNDKAAAFLEASAPLLEKGFRVNVYDQGYAAATDPMRELLLISVIFLAVCILMALCALALQSHLFVNRQRETALTMHALGSGRPHVFVYFLSSSAALTALASALGGSAARLLESRVFALLRNYASRFAAADTRFSSGSIALTRTLEFAPSSDIKVYLFAVLALILGAVVLTLVFSAGALREKAKAAKKKSREKKRGMNRSAKTSKLSGFFKYGLLSLWRGRLRTAAVIAMGMTAAVFFLRLTASLDGYEEQLDSYRENAEIRGYATDLEGHRISGLVLRAKPLIALGTTDLTKDLCASVKFGHIMFINEVGNTFAEYKEPASEFAREAMFDKIWNGPSWTGVTSVENSPPFHYSKSGSVEWLEGWSDEDFRSTVTASYLRPRWDPKLGEFVMEETEYVTGPSVCALPNGFMEEYGIELGDELTAVYACYLDGDNTFIGRTDTIKVVARCTSPTGSTDVFSPAMFVLPHSKADAMTPDDFAAAEAGRSVWVGEHVISSKEFKKAAEMGIDPRRTFSSYTFSLSDSTRLDELRGALIDAGFTYIGSGDRAAVPAVIEDETYLNTTHSMERQIQYVTALYSSLCALSGITGFALAWLTAASRRKEIAVMRALGTPPIRILLNFLLEQTLLILAGLGVGLAAPMLFGSMPSRAALMLSAAFLVLWCLAAFICLAVSLLKKSYAALTEPE